MITLRCLSLPKSIVIKASSAIITIFITTLSVGCSTPPITIYDQHALPTIKTVSVAPFVTPDSSSIPWSLPLYLDDSRDGFINGLKSEGFAVVDNSDSADAVFITDLTVSGYLAIGICGGWDHYVDGLNTSLYERKTGKMVLSLHHRNENVKLKPRANGVALAELVHRAWSVPHNDASEYYTY